MKRKKILKKEATFRTLKEGEKDLEVTVDEELKFEKQTQYKVATAKMLGFIRQTFKHLNRSFSLLYKSMVRPT